MIELKKGHRYLLRKSYPSLDIHEVKIVGVSEDAYKILYLSGYKIWKSKQDIDHEYEFFEELI